MLLSGFFKHYSWHVQLARWVVCTGSVLLLCKATAQPLPYLKKLNFNVPTGLGSQAVRRGPDGQLLLCYNPRISGNGSPVGYLKMNDTGLVQEAHGFDAGRTGGNELFDLLELPDGRKLCLMQLEVQINGIEVARPRYFVKMFSPDLKEEWSLSLTEGRSFSRSLPALCLGADGSIYGIGERFVLTLTGFQVTHLMYKISLDGNLLWCRETDWVLTDLEPAPDGSLLLSATRFRTEGSMLLRLNSNGSVLEARRVGNVAIRDLDLFPGGDILLSGHDVTNDAGKVMLRLNPALKLVAARRISSRSYASEFRNVFVAGDQLLYYLFDPPDGEFGRVLIRLDGSLQAEKAVLLPKESGHVAPISLGPGDFLLPTRVATHGLSLSLLHLDSTLTLPGDCPIKPPPYCFKTQAWTPELTNDGAVEFMPITPESVVQPVIWKDYQVSASDYCFEYVPPKAIFSLPDTVCQGAVYIPDSLKNFDGAYWSWTFEGGTPVTADRPQPEVIFRDIGRRLVTQRVRFLGCSEDYYTQYIEVVPQISVSLGPDTALCAGQVLQISALAPGARQWLWDDKSTATQRIISISGRYRVTVSNATCSASDTVLVAFRQADAAFTAPDSLCAGGLLRLQAELASSGVSHSWALKPPVFNLETKAVPSPVPLQQAQAYTIRHFAQIGQCSDTVEKTVQVIAPPLIDLGSDQTLCADSSLLLRPLISNGQFLSWHDGTSDPERQAAVPGIYICTAQNGMCRAADTLRLYSKTCGPTPYYIPNAFAPNGQSGNRLFSVHYKPDKVQSVVSMDIFDRWGNLVFQAQGDNGWDGQVRSQAAAAGVYLYRVVLLMGDGDTRVLSGNFVLVR